MKSACQARIYYRDREIAEQPEPVSEPHGWRGGQAPDVQGADRVGGENDQSNRC